MKIACGILIFALTTGLAAERIAVLPEVGRPGMMALNAQRLYITEGATVYVYSRPDYRLVKRFGKSGEGPREFKISPFGVPLFVDATLKGVFVSSDSKISWFTRDGEFVREQRVPPLMVFRPFSGGYVATSTAGDDDGRMVLVINLYDRNFNKVRTLYRSDIEVGPNASFNYPMTSISFEMLDGRIYVASGGMDFAIDVFDAAGKPLYRIVKAEKNFPVSADYRRRTLEWFKNDPNWGRLWEYLRNRFSFKSHFPCIQDITVQDGRIFVLTNHSRGEDMEMVILDLKGKELARKWVPLQRVYGMEFVSKYRIFKKRFFLLRENADEEEWELHAVSLH